MEQEIQKLVKQFTDDNIDVELNYCSELKCYSKVLFRNSEIVKPGVSKEIEILAKNSVFKPQMIYVVGLDSNNPNNDVKFEILNVKVMDISQPISNIYRNISVPQTIDWNVFGSKEGQGLKITIQNLESEVSAIFYIALWGIYNDTNGLIAISE